MGWKRERLFSKITKCQTEREFFEYYPSLSQHFNVTVYNVALGVYRCYWWLVFSSSFFASSSSSSFLFAFRTFFPLLNLHCSDRLNDASLASAKCTYFSCIFVLFYCFLPFSTLFHSLQPKTLLKLISKSSLLAFAPKLHFIIQRVNFILPLSPSLEYTTTAGVEVIHLNFNHNSVWPVAKVTQGRANIQIECHSSPLDSVENKLSSRLSLSLSLSRSLFCGSFLLAQRKFQFLAPLDSLTFHCDLNEKIENWIESQVISNEWTQVKWMKMNCLTHTHTLATTSKYYLLTPGPSIFACSLHFLSPLLYASVLNYNCSIDFIT